MKHLKGNVPMKHLKGNVPMKHLGELAREVEYYYGFTDIDPRG
jgi:hypothetical protein